uniref:Uncharacterized protein n=1 Tax=Magallana gigas TaxID=29159 RepID=K1Q5V6_MAGGI
MVFFSKCLEISVNVEQVREVFVTNCRVNKVIVTGDTARFTISIKDTNGLNCEPYKNKDHVDVQNTEAGTHRANYFSELEALNQKWSEKLNFTPARSPSVRKRTPARKSLNDPMTANQTARNDPMIATQTGLDNATINILTSAATWFPTSAGVHGQPHNLEAATSAPQMVPAPMAISQLINQDYDQTHPRIAYEENPESSEENNTEDTTPDKFDLEDSCENEKSRFEGKFSDTKELLAVIKARKKKKNFLLGTCGTDSQRN